VYLVDTFALAAIVVVDVVAIVIVVIAAARQMRFNCRRCCNCSLSVSKQNALNAFVSQRYKRHSG